MTEERNPLRVRVASPDGDESAATDDLDRTLLAARRLLFKYPVAAQALFSAFVADGRRFAQTPEGARWKEDLAQSDLVRRARTLWDTSTLNMLGEAPPAALPTAFVNAVVQAVSASDVESLLSRVFEGEPDHGRSE